MKQSGWLQQDGRSQKTCPTRQQRTQNGDDAIRRTQLGSPLPTSIQNEDLVTHQDGFGNNRTEAARPTKLDNDDDGMQKKGKKCRAFSGWYQMQKAEEFTALLEFATHRYAL